MKTSDKPWTREQTIVAFGLYCKIPFNRATSGDPDIIKTAKAIGRSTNSVKMKVGNFGSFDHDLKRRGIVGLANTSRLDKEIWDEFNNDWENLAFESERILADFEKKDLAQKVIYDTEEIEIREGLEVERTVKARINQQFFRRTVLSSYNFTCCITGINIPELLVASHIVPWSVEPTNRLNPRNGLCLNALHDKAFDVGLITVTPDFRLSVSSLLLRNKNSQAEWIKSFNGKTIKLPDKFVPLAQFLKYHNRNVFRP